MPIRRCSNHRRRSLARVPARARSSLQPTAVTCTLGALWIACGNASDGTYLADCQDPLRDPATGKLVCVVDTPKINPTKCCKVDEHGNVDTDDCGGVVITKTSYWCVTGADYVGVHCRANPNGNSETCTKQPSPPSDRQAPECEHYITSASGLRVCADQSRRRPPAAGWNCCFEPMSTCTQRANTRWQKDADETPTLVVHCGEGSHPVFCQDSKIGLICTTTEQAP